MNNDPSPMLAWGLVLLFNGLLLHAFIALAQNVKAKYDYQMWSSKHHNPGDYWDGEGLDDEFGTIGSDGRPTARYR